MFFLSIDNEKIKTTDTSARVRAIQATIKLDAVVSFVLNELLRFECSYMLRYSIQMHAFILHYNQRATRSYFSGATNDDGAYRRNAISNVSKTSADSLHFVIYINNWMYWIEPVVRWHFSEVVHRRPKSASNELNERFINLIV